VAFYRQHFNLFNMCATSLRIRVFNSDDVMLGLPCNIYSGHK